MDRHLPIEFLNDERRLLSLRQQQTDPVRSERPADFLKAIESHAAVTHYRRNETIYDAGDPAEYWYMVASGIAGRCAVLADGRRQIVDLLVPGDFFGFYAGDAHRFSVEAVTNKTSILRYPRHSVEAIVESSPKLQYCVRQMAFEAILRLDARILTVGRMTAVEKVGSFLIEMAERFPQSGGMRIALPLSRYDIADYLGLSMETVSRSLAELKRRGAITFSGPHRVTVLNPEALRGE